MTGSVAICTLASELLMNDLWEAAPRGGGITGRTLAESFGVEKVVTNIVANPRLRTPILCGTESRHRVGQILLSLHANGRDTDSRVVNSEDPQPVVRSLSDDAVRIYQEKLTVVDLRGEEDGEVILARAVEAAVAAADQWPEQWEPSVGFTRLDDAALGGTAGRFTQDPTGLFLIGQGPWGDTVEMEHYTREGYLDHRVEGGSAEPLIRALLETGLVDDLSHALYLGSELKKTEVALRLHLSYEQDRSLELAEV